MRHFLLTFARRYAYLLPAIFILTGAGSEITAPITVSCIRWAHATTVGHELILTESSAGNTNNVIWPTIAAGSEYVEESCALRDQSLSKGIRIGTIGSGKVWVYTKSPHCGTPRCSAHMGEIEP